jgi:hypothetical protein
MKYLIIADPSGHTTLSLIQTYGISPSDIYVWEDSTKGHYSAKIRGVTVTDNLDEFDGMKFDVVIGNPPYGSGGNLAIRFLNKCADLSDDIRLVMPVSIRKPSSQNKVRLDLICIEDVTLPDTTFGKTIKTVRQRWIKTDTLRDKISTFTTHPDLEFVSYNERHDANVFIGLKGGGPGGRVKTENFEHYADTGHHLIKCSKKVQERLVALEPQFREEALITQVPSLGKNELISIYMNNYE